MGEMPHTSEPFYMFEKFRQIFTEREKTSTMRIFTPDRKRVMALQKAIAHELNLTYVSQAQVIRYLLNFEKVTKNKDV